MTLSPAVVVAMALLWAFCEGARDAKASQTAASAVAASAAKPYYIPERLVFSDEEIGRIRAAAVERNIAVLNAEHKERLDREDYLTDLSRRREQERQYQDWRQQQVTRVFQRQALFSDVVFAVANLVVLLGLSLTIWQFSRDHFNWKRIAAHNARLLVRHLQSNRTKGAPELLETGDPEHKIALKLDGIEIGTRATGLAILMISLGFYYLMLVYVYEVKTLSVVPFGTAASAPQGQR